VFRATTGLATVLCLLPGVAYAHVKWFAAYDVAAPPEPLSAVFSSQFIGFLFFTAYVLAVVFLIDCVLADRGWNKLVDMFFDRFRPYSPDILRICLGAFLLCLWLRGGIILTPELKTDSAWIPWFQLVLAICTISWRTTFITGIGLFVLYGIAIYEYGVFHLMDYPLFLGIAVYLGIRSLDIERLAPYALSILYVSTVQTLLWASIEKWAYWNWTMPLLETHREITFGIDPRAYIMLAGFVEFAATYVLLVGRLSQRASAFALLVIFIAAIVDFGKLDAVGHLMIIATLAVFVINGTARINAVFHSTTAPYLVECSKLVGVFLLSLVLYFSQYYILHAVLFGT